MIKSMSFTMQFRCISTGSKMYKAVASNSQFARIINKVMQSDRTKKNLKGPVDHSSPVSVNFGRGAKNSTHKNRRVTVLNKVFMKYITDLMATGEVGSKLLNKGIEISHVNVASDYSVIHVYWFSQSSNIADEDLEKILNTSAGHLQHELSQLRVIGLVPPIKFVKNKEFSVIKEVEDRLAKVDFGEDYTPTAHIVSSKIPTLETSLSEELKAKISQVDGTSSDSNNNEEFYKLDIPEMRQDVMGFDHSKIMQKVQGSINKSILAQQNKDADTLSEPKGCEEPTPGEVIDFLSSREQNQLFTDFLKKRQIEEKRKQQKVSLFDVKIQEEMDWLERMKEDSEYIEDIDIDEKDYYEDDLNSKDR